MRPMPKGLKPPNPSGSHDGSEEGTVSTVMPLAANPASNAAALAGRQKPRGETHQTRSPRGERTSWGHPGGWGTQHGTACTVRQCSDKVQVDLPAFSGLIVGAMQTPTCVPALQRAPAITTPAIQFQLHSKPAPASKRGTCENYRQRGG